MKNISPRSARARSPTRLLWNRICGCTPARSRTFVNSARSLSHRWIFGWNILGKNHVENICEQYLSAILVCNLCKKSFSQLPHLKKHMLCVHNTDKPYYCEKCEGFYKVCQLSIKKSRNGDTLGPVELIIWPVQGNQGDWREQDG